MTRTDRLTKQERSDVRSAAGYAARWGLGIVASVIAVSLAYAFLIRPLFLDADARARRAGFERQDTNRDLIAAKIVEHGAATNDAHRAALVNLICQKADETRGALSPTSEQFIATHC